MSEIVKAVAFCLLSAGLITLFVGNFVNASPGLFVFLFFWTFLWALGATWATVKFLRPWMIQKWLTEEEIKEFENK